MTGLRTLDAASPLNNALVALLADSGPRISEALKLRIEDANFAGRTVHVRDGRAAKTALVEAPHPAARMRGYGAETGGVSLDGLDGAPAP